MTIGRVHSTSLAGLCFLHKIRSGSCSAVQLSTKEGWHEQHLWASSHCFFHRILRGPKRVQHCTVRDTSPRQDSYTWSCMRDNNGDTTTVSPLETTAGNCRGCKFLSPSWKRSNHNLPLSCHNAIKPYSHLRSGVESCVYTTNLKRRECSRELCGNLLSWLSKATHLVTEGFPSTCGH